MEEQANHRDLLGHVVRPPSLRTGSLKATLSGRSTPRNSPSFRRSQSGKTPRKEVRVYTGPLQWLRGRRLLPWLILLGIWSYVGFHVQSKWAHNADGDEPGLTVFGSRVEGDQGSGNHVDQAVKKLDTLEDRSSVFSSNNSSEHINKLLSYVKKPHVGLQSPVNLNRWFWRRKQALEQGKRGDNVQQESSSNSSFNQTVSSKHVEESLPNRTLHENVVIKNMRTTKLTKGRDETSVTGNDTMPMNIIGETAHMDARVKRNTSYGLLVGPFDKTENRVLGWNSGKRYSTCNRKGSFAHIVRGRSFIVVLHELSMTGAPLAMMELATEILSCGGRVSAIALSRKGGLMGELSRRGIKLLKDKSVGSFRTAMKADIVIAGSAVSALWIEQYLLHYKRASDKLIWWIMENRREYFDRSKHMLQKVKALVFLSELQSQQWLAWCAEEGIKLPSTLEVVPLSVNDELAFVAGLQTALNTPLYSVERMLEKRKALREEVRNSMGLDPNDMLVMTLSSINPGKGQLILLKAGLMIVDENFIPKINPDHVESKETSKNASDGGTSKNAFGGEDPIVKSKGISRVLSEFSYINEGGKYDSSKTIAAMTSWKQDPVQNASFKSTPSNLTYSSHTENLNRGQQMRKLLADLERNRNQTLKLLIGSVGSKSNKVPYIKSMLGLISHHPELARFMLWTPTTVHVAPLYAAADVYVINAQGIGETFGRVTIEAMAFGLPVLGTDAGGTTEIVENNVTGLLHPVGQKGVHVLSQHIRLLLKNQTMREEMGWKGREKVEKLFLKHHMYDKLAEILKKCMRYS